MIDKAQKTKILMENFNKYIISENNTDTLELNKYARELYSIIKKFGIPVSIIRGKKEIKSDESDAGIAYLYVEYYDEMPMLKCTIQDIRKISKDVGNKLLNSIKSWLPSNLEQVIKSGGGWSGEVMEIYFRIKSENRTEKEVGSDKSSLTGKIF